ncbi:MAG: endonuclease/exonuclease/phosphatase family protein [Bacteroidota bacterium]
MIGALLLSSSLSAAELTHIGQAARLSLPATELKILVWNIHRGDDDLFSYDYQKLTRDKDLVLLQEANLDSDLARTLKLPKLQLVHAESFTSPLSSTKMGVATLSKAAPVTNVGLKSPVTELKTTTPKVSLIQTFRLSGTRQTLLVANVHAINFVPNVDFVKHIAQISKAIAFHRGPMIVAGDFNTWNVDRLIYLDKILSVIKLKRVDFPAGRTRFPSIGYILGTLTGGELDHVYVRGLKVIDSHVEVTVTTSDHKPLELTLDLH